MTARIDRRVARTRETLHQALMALIVRKGFDATTVQDIIDEADVGRSTFYAHYTGKEDLLRSGFERLRAQLEAARTDGRSAAIASGRRFAFSLALFEHASGYAEVYRALVGGRGGHAVLMELRRALSDMVRADRETTVLPPDVPRELYERFVVDAFLSVLTWWLERRPLLPPREVDGMFRRLALCGEAS